ncbi:NAD-dependent epimerase/dehydratase family protein [Sphingobacterium lactis]|uniref:NAD-dependent epimerase/dehydratase family protein n=1 Tax=Sphingobacterium lactis TaxID=797291 RepID=UPI003F7D6024
MKIKVIITGSTGMVGEGVLQECLVNPSVEEILLINRKPYAIQDPKVKEVILSDFNDLSSLGDSLKDYDACYFCAGVSSIGLSEDEYYKLTYSLTLNFAKSIAAINPNMVFCYVSGRGTDSSEEGRVSWARVKGKTENDLMKLPFKAVYNFRPAFMKPTEGAKNIKPLFKVISFLYPIMRPFNKAYFLTLTEVGKAMINVSLDGYNKNILEIQDISFLAKE